MAPLTELRLVSVPLAEDHLAELSKLQLRILELRNVDLGGRHLELLEHADGIENLLLTEVRAPMGLANALPKKLRPGRTAVLKGLQPPQRPPLR